MDVCIPQQGPAILGNPFSLHKFAGKLCLMLQDWCGCHCWKYYMGWGALCCWKVSWQNFFHNCLAHWLGKFKHVKADDGYNGEAPQKVKYTGSVANLIENLGMQSRVHTMTLERSHNWMGHQHTISPPHFPFNTGESTSHKIMTISHYFD